MSHESASESSLVERAGYDQASFQALYDLYFKRVYSYVVARVNNTQDAEDLVSDIFLRVMKGLRTLKNQHRFSFAAWIFTIARNSVTDFYRRQKHKPVELGLEELKSGNTVHFDPDTSLINDETQVGLRKVLSLLPERRREVITLKYFGGLRNLEIAEVLHIDERTVASHLSRGLKDLYDMCGETPEVSKGTFNVT